MGMRNGRRGTIATGVAAVAILGALAVGPVANAGTRTVVARGTCSGESHWRLALVQDHGRIGLSFSVIEGVRGDPWRVRILHNRHVIFRGLQVTHGEEGAFTIRLSTRNTPGPDLFRARARNLQTDEVCRGRAAI